MCWVLLNTYAGGASSSTASWSVYPCGQWIPFGCKDDDFVPDMPPMATNSIVNSIQASAASSSWTHTHGSIISTESAPSAQQLPPCDACRNNRLQSCSVEEHDKDRLTELPEGWEAGVRTRGSDLSTDYVSCMMGNKMNLIPTWPVLT